VGDYISCFTGCTENIIATCIVIGTYVSVLYVRTVKCVPCIAWLFHVDLWFAYFMK
jgi:hypothetical protein